ncbi:MAG: sulfite exporter TauE/SafE family protein [Oscillospiraceae bacterium]|nr:sulfite exporter TauE/SafE family protein [Oscillospiraceae bacterium]
MKLAAVAIASFIAGFLQGCTGFGAVMIMMMILPFYFPMTDAIGIANSSTIAGNISVAYQYRKSFSIIKILVPSLISMFVNGIAIMISVNADKVMVKKAFGIFLVLIAIYYLFLNRGKNLRMPSSLRISLVVAFAITSAFFGIGGPLMAIYFMNTTDSREEYLGSIQFFFMLTSLFNIVFRSATGLLGKEHILPILVGMAGVVTSGLISKPFVKHMNVKHAEILTYVFVGLTGLYNMFF